MQHLSLPDGFVDFLLCAKRHTYASGGAMGTRVEPALSGASQLEYGDGEWVYRDLYFGNARFAGQETVYLRGAPVWAMCYAGGLTVDFVAPGDVYPFLQRALQQGVPDRPYRGPHIFRDGHHLYTDESQGGLDDFRGVEAVSYRGQAVYQLHYMGGALR